MVGELAFIPYLDFNLFYTRQAYRFGAYQKMRLIHFLSTTELNISVEGYNFSRDGVVCRVVVPKFKHGNISKRFELEG